MLGAAAADATRVEAPGDRTAVDLPATGAPPVAGPVLVDDDLEPGIDGSGPRRRWPWVVLVAALAALVGGGGAWAYVSAQVPSYEVPGLVGLSEDEALALIADYGWEIDRVEDRADGTQPGEVLDTDPSVGELLEEDGTLRLVVSLGNELAPVPTDLAGKPLEEVTAILAQAGGFTPEVAEEVFDEGVPKGVVMSLAPDVPAELPKESAVPLIVSKGPQPRTVPEGLEGGSFEDAKAALEAIQLQAAKVEEFSDDVEAGRVIGLRPGAGESVERDGTVEVVVSKGPDLVTVPDVKGRSLDEAVATLEAAGLTVGDAFGPANGRPFDTDPPKGTKVRRGTTVDIYLRR
jgi:serine/threonine-protein kinase